MAEIFISQIRREIRRNADYIQTVKAMRDFTNTRTSDTADVLWQVEHPPIFTLGQAGRIDHVLDAGTIPVIRTERGGQVTYHGPGQVVIYVLFDIRRRGIFVKNMVCRLEQAMIDALTEFGVANAQRKPDAPGVYVPDPTRSASATAALAKIGAIGLKVSRGCTYHGVALNVDMDLSPFRRINPCGYAGLNTVDMATMGARTDWQQVADRLSDQIEIHCHV